MARLPDVTDAEMPEALRDSVASQLKAYGLVLNSTRQVAHTPEISLGAGAMSRGLARSHQVSRRLSHLLNLRVAGIVGCPQ